MTSSPCYCCPPRNNKREDVDTASSSVELDRALNELGMLSTVTNIRMECPFRTTWYCGNKECAYAEGSSKVASDENLCARHHGKRYAERYAPYKPRRGTKHLPITEFEDYTVSSLKDVVFEFVNGVAIEVKTNSTTVSRQDSGNKSNPGSPVKNQKNGGTTSGCSITRSRSLDDLEIGKLNLHDGCSNEAGKTDIETNLSQRISNLHVN